VAKVRVNINQAREELETCVKNQEFQRAAELKESIHSLEQERSSLLNATEPSVEEIRTERVCFFLSYTNREDFNSEEEIRAECMRRGFQLSPQQRKLELKKVPFFSVFILHRFIANLAVDVWIYFIRLFI
jgi:hypothetical protein